MTNHTPHTPEDQLLKDLFRDFEPDQAPKNLKHQTMNKILQEWSANPVPYSGSVLNEYRWWFLSGIAGVLMLVFISDYTTLNSYWENLTTSNSLHVKNTMASFKSIFMLLQKIPPIYLFIGLGIGILTAFDKMLAKLSGI
jgi:hypothetical protein